MNSSNNSKWILAAAIAGIVAGSMIASPASAQFATGANGHATDVNNRVGSGGYNNGSSRPPLNANDYVTGNVTGGKQFRGFVPYTSPGAFRGNLPGQGIDNFVSSSAGTPIGVYNNNNAGNTVPFYGLSYGAAPPPGFGSTVTTNGQYLPNAPLQRGAGDARLGDLFTNYQSGPQAGTSILPGPTSADNTPTVITASPLYGVRTWALGDNADQQFLNSYAGANSGQSRSSQLSNLQIDRMRAELAGQPIQNQPTQALDVNGQPLAPNGNQSQSAQGKSSNPTDAGVSGTNGVNGSNPDGTTAAPDRNAPLDNSAQQPMTNSTSVNNQPVNSASNNAPQSNDLGTTGVRNRMVANVPQNLRSSISDNSPAVQELNRRFAQYKKGGQMTADVEANQKFNELRREVDASKKAGGKVETAPPGTTPPPSAPGLTPAPTGQPQPNNAMPGVTPTPGAPTSPNAPKTSDAMPGVQPAAPQAGTSNAPKPMVVSSLPHDMKPSAVTALMTDAEKLMKDGKYTSALDKYDMVDQVAPNDPLAEVGRATAELGASYYSRADAHLHEAFTRNPALLLAQYDLRVFLGNERLNYLIKDLKDIANSEAKQPRPAFLLAYIYYNVGDERRAAGYLDLAEKRAGGNDPFFKLLRQHWALPSDAGSSEELNK